MADTLTDAVPQILIKIQDSISTLRSDLTGRLERIETLVKQRREGAAMLVMMRATVSDFDERVSDVEERLSALEAKQADADAT
jgi:phage-related minor tail protein